MFLQHELSYVCGIIVNLQLSHVATECLNCFQNTMDPFLFFISFYPLVLNSLAWEKATSANEPSFNRGPNNEQWKGGHHKLVTFLYCGSKNWVICEVICRHRYCRGGGELGTRSKRIQSRRQSHCLHWCPGMLSWQNYCNICIEIQKLRII